MINHKQKKKNSIITLPKNNSILDKNKNQCIKMNKTYLIDH